MYRVLALFFLLFFSITAPAATVPALAPPAWKTPAATSIRKPGKLTRLQRFALKLALRKWKKRIDGTMTEKQRKQGVASMILGIASLVMLITPLAILSLPAAIVAVVLGSQSAKGNKNSQAIAGIIMGSITLALFLLVLIIIALYLPVF